MKYLRVAEKMNLPLDFMTMATVVYGARGSGKTTFGAVVGEELHAARQRFCAIDLKGDFYGLRSSADGRQDGIPVVIFGGDHADVPLEPDAGKFLGELVASMEQSVVLDFENMSKGKQIRFLGEFFAALYHANREPLLVICDEAQRYAPQRTSSPDQNVCLGAVEDLVKLGRKHGLGVLLLTQRGAGLNKEVSEICDALVAFRTPSSIDQARISDWLGANGYSDEIVGTIASFNKGCALFASAHPELNVFKTVQMRPRWTFDSSATPKVGQKRREPKKLAKPELEALRTKLADAIERAKAEDPKELRKRIAELQKQLSVVKDGMRDAEIEQLTIDNDNLARSLAEERKKKKVVEKAVMREADVKRLETALTKATAARQDAAEKIARADAAAKAVVDGAMVALAKTRAPLPLPVVETEFKRKPTKIVALPKAAAAAKVAKRESAGDFKMTPAAQRILDAIAWFGVVRIAAPSRAAIAGRARMKQSGHFNNTLGALHSAGFVAYPMGGYVSLTDGGRAVANTPDEQPTLAGLHDSVRSILTAFQAQLVDALIKVYPGDCSRAELADAVNKQESGHFNNTLGALRTMQLIDYPEKGRVRASDHLFPEGLK